MTALNRALRVLLGAVFVLAGGGKLTEPGLSRLAPVILGETSGPIVAIALVVEDALPLLEVLCGAAIWCGLGRAARTVLGATLSGLFVAVAALVPDGVRCGCFGALGDFESRAGHLSFASALLVAVILFGILDRRSGSPSVASP